MAQSSSPFRFLFWGLVAIVALSFGGLILFQIARNVWWAGPHLRILGPLGLPPLLHLPLLLFVLVAGVIGTAVYRDAQRRGMDPWLWAAVAVFVPALIGVVVYLVVRSSPACVCLQCGRSLGGDFRLCPYCGHPREACCVQCGRPVAAEWKVCPQCGRRLESGPDDAQPGQSPMDHGSSPR